MGTITYSIVTITYSIGTLGVCCHVIKVFKLKANPDTVATLGALKL
jgi:hypothetical protein